MATEVIKDVGGGANDYPSLTAWEAGQQGDLVAADQIRTARCFAYEDAGVTIDGSTTDATRYLKIVTDASARHSGTWDATKFRIKAIGGVSNAISVRDNFIQISGLQMELAHTVGQCTWGGACIWVFLDTTPEAIDITIDGCILRGTNFVGVAASADSYSKGVYFQSGGTGRAKVSNCIAYDFLGAVGGTALGIGFHNYAVGTGYFYNCTAYNCKTGFNNSWNIGYAKDCLAQSCATNGFYGSEVWRGNNNTTDMVGDSCGTSRTVATITFVNAAGKNFHIASAIGGGADLSADAIYPISIDIDGQTRTGTWDCGADQYVATGTNHPLTGDLIGLGSVEGSINRLLLINGSALATSSVTSSLIRALLLNGEAAGGAAATGALARLLTLSGLSDGLGSAIGDLEVIIAAQALTGEVLGTSDVSGVLILNRALSGAVVGAGAMEAALILHRALSGTTSASSLITSTLTLRSILTGVTTGRGLADGTLTLIRPFPPISGIRVMRWSGAR